MKFNKPKYFFYLNWQFFKPASTLTPETSYETSRGWNREQIERRTSNVQRRMYNIDDATLYLFKKKWTQACNALSPVGFRRVDSMAHRRPVHCVLFSIFLN